uniref:Uncharacterized protein n=1 Tax=Brassica campestris TaxID=3711 RepID=A0A3P6AYJ7_BRACM|nr:unnamed protein product [Brassica rapa]
MQETLQMIVSGKAVCFPAHCLIYLLGNYDCREVICYHLCLETQLLPTVRKNLLRL